MVGHPGWREILEAWSRVRVLLVGDFLLDRWIYGTIDRISREAPVFIVEHETESWGLGGAANTAAQLRAFGAEVWAVGWLGEDAAGERLLHMLQERGVRTDGMVWLGDRPTVVKTRIVAGPPYAVKQQVLRLDRGRSAADADGYIERVLRSFSTLLPVADIVLVSDYGYGAGQPGMAATLVRMARSAHVPLIGDSRYSLPALRGADALTPNESELAAVTGRSWRDVEGLFPVARDFCHQIELAALLVTRGSQGMALYERETARWTTIPVHGSPVPVDVAGAGDTVLATFGLAYAVTRDFRTAARLANVAAGIVVMKKGVAQATVEELRQAIEGDRQADR
ncbi:MAG: bifunctional ADP-heptose synthase [Acidobacteria bacterium]|nr:bifunctional ADP-heptose synthase [Acidobacteriota bacterium]MDW7984130.1 bifunctional ADP-heptose synthase [Acidobacteriota bacterium]